jgi:hypothetical protein
VTNNRNVFQQAYNQRTNRIGTAYQQGFLPHSLSTALRFKGVLRYWDDPPPQHTRKGPQRKTQGTEGTQDLQRLRINRIWFVRCRRRPRLLRSLRLYCDHLRLSSSGLIIPLLRVKFSFNKSLLTIPLIVKQATPSPT